MRVRIQIRQNNIVQTHPTRFDLETTQPPMTYPHLIHNNAYPLWYVADSDHSTGKHGWSGHRTSESTLGHSFGKAQTAAGCDVSYGDVSASTRAVSWPDGGAYVRDEVAEHVRDFSPEIAMSDQCMRSESAQSIPNNEGGYARNEVGAGGTVRRVVVVCSKGEVCHECEEQSAYSVAAPLSFCISRRV